MTDNGPGGPRTASLTGLGTTPATCVSNTLSNAGFESGTLDCWTAGGALTPAIATQQSHAGSFSAQLGAIGLPQPSGDSWMYQTVTVPTGLQNPTLTFWFWPSSEDSIGYDWQEAQIRDSGGNMLAQVLKVASNTQTWTYSTFDLTPYKGQTVQLYFNVHEDGDSYGYLTYMYLDDIAIVDGAPSLRFVPVTPCRVVDTRDAHGAFGGPAISWRNLARLRHSAGKLRHSRNRPRLCAEYDGHSPRAALLPDDLADWSDAACGFHFEFAGRPHQGERRNHPGGHLAVGERFRQQHNRCSARHQRIFCTGRHGVRFLPADTLPRHRHPQCQRCRWADLACRTGSSATFPILPGDGL